MRVRELVLLHGWGSGAGIWDVLARRLAPHFRIHALSLPGYGAEPVHTARSLRAIVVAIAQAAPRRCGVIGWSLGGEVALAWARCAQRQVQRLALIATTPCFTSRPGWPCATSRAVLNEFARFLATDRDGTLARFTAAQAKGDARARRVASVLHQFNVHGAPTDVLLAGLDVLTNTDMRRDLSLMKQPTLVMHGARDRIVPPAAGRRLAAALPDARFMLLRACAHAPFVSQPGRVAHVLREFFDE
jgi:pimeloyl-[acyl-carrier protein] methyl ester esterase